MALTRALGGLNARLARISTFLREWGPEEGLWFGFRLVKTGAEMLRHAHHRYFFFDFFSIEQITSGFLPVI